MHSVCVDEVARPRTNKTSDPLSDKMLQRSRRKFAGFHFTEKGI
jgi:hypothetical protein